MIFKVKSLTSLELQGRVVLQINIFTRVLLVFLLVLNLSCSKEKPSDTLNLGLRKGVSSLDPVRAFDQNSLMLLGQSYETLYQYHYLLRPFKIIPLLASGFPEIKNNGKTYIIRLKEKVPYHDHPAFKGKTRFVKAQDFINQIKRLGFDPLQSTGRWLFKGIIEGFNEFSDLAGVSQEKFWSEKIRGIKAIDDHTLEIKLNKNISNFIHLFTFNFVVPVPKEILEFTKNNLEKDMVGTGPYYLAQSNPKGYFFKKFDGYRNDIYPSVGDRYSHTFKLLKSAHKRIPFLSKINFHVMESNEAIWKAFLNGEIDLIELPRNKIGLAMDKMGKLSADLIDKGIVLKRFPALINRWLAFNMRDPIVGTNKNIRLAIAYAINRDAYNAAVRQSTALPANSVYTPGVSGYNPNQSLPYSINLVKARALMKEAGYGPGKILKLTYSTRGKKEDSKKEADFLKTSLKEIGIDLDVQYLEFREFLTKGRRGELQFFTDNWIYDYPDVSNLLQLLITPNFPGINKTGFSNANFDLLFSKIESLPDNEERVSLIRKMEQIIHREIPWIMLSYERTVVLHYKYVKNFRKSSFIRNYLKYIKIEF